MKVLVTGGAGFIGSHIVDLFIQKNEEVVIIDSLISGPKYINNKAKFYQMDIRNSNVEEIFEKEKPDYVYHLASQVDVNQSITDPQYDASVNIIGTLLILKACVKYGVKKVIYSSSSAVYGETDSSNIREDNNVAPISFYGVSKNVPELYLKVFSKLYGLNYTILRYSNVYGNRQGFKAEGAVIPNFIYALLNNQSPTIFGSGNQSRDFICAADVAEANLCALSKANHETLNISTFSSVTINELYQELITLMDKNIAPIYKETRPGDIMHSLLNNEKAKNLLQWSPKYSLREGLKRTIYYYNDKLHESGS